VIATRSTSSASDLRSPSPRRSPRSLERSAASMLTFINRAGENLSKRRLDLRQRSKAALRHAFHRHWLAHRQC